MKNISALPLLFLVFLLAGCATTKDTKEQAAQQTLEPANETSEIEVNEENGTLDIVDKPFTSQVEQSQANYYLLLTEDHKVAEKHLVQIGRYSATHPIPTQEQQDILKVIIKVTLPKEIDTTGQAVRYLLKRSGYQLAAPQAQGPEVLQLLVKKLLCLLKIESPANKSFVEDTRLMPRLENNGDLSHRPVAI